MAFTSKDGSRREPYSMAIWAELVREPTAAPTWGRERSERKYLAMRFVLNFGASRRGNTKTKSVAKRYCD